MRWIDSGCVKYTRWNFICSVCFLHLQFTGNCLYISLLSLYQRKAVLLNLDIKLSWSDTAQKIKFFIKDFFSECDQIRSFLRILSHLLKKSLMENFIFCAVRICDDKGETIRSSDIWLYHLCIQWIYKLPQPCWSVSALEICRSYKIVTVPNWYKHEPLPVIDNNSNITVLWDFPVQTERTFYVNRLDIAKKIK